MLEQRLGIVGGGRDALGWLSQQVATSEAPAPGQGDNDMLEVLLLPSY